MAQFVFMGARNDKVDRYIPIDEIRKVLNSELGTNLEEEDYANLMQKSAWERCEWLVYQNRYFLMRDKDWETIFTHIFEQETSFERYYPMMRVKCNTDNLVYLVRSFALNDDFYEYAKEVTTE